MPATVEARRLWGQRWVYFFLVPTLLLYGTYTIWPLAATIYFSLLDWTGFEQQGAFVGLANYGELLQDQYFWNAFRVTMIFMVTAVPLRVGLALLLAIILNGRLPFAKIFRTALFLPVVTTAAIVGVVMRFVLDPASGPVNLALTSIGVLDRPLNLLGTAGTSLFTAVGVWVWKWLGITLIYWLAALQTIPRELYDAARIDGAGHWQQFWHITAPMLMPFLIIITLITAVDAANVFDLMLTLTGGGPFYTSEVIDIFVFGQAFAAVTPRLGYASAAALFFGVCFAVLVAAQVLIGARTRNTWGR